ncbi:MAG: baseplate J/gp47 family protein [Synergistaceae bacterium]
MIDLSKLPAPNIIEELNYETILAAMRADLEDRLPGWTAAVLESDPANKILEVAAYRELLLRQRINEAIKACMIAFASGSDLEHLSAFFAVARLEGAAATFPARLTLSAALSQDITIPAGFSVIDLSGENNTALLKDDVVISAGQISLECTFEVSSPKGDAANGLKTDWEAITPLPWVIKVTQFAEATGGSDAESDNSLRTRTQLSPESWSTAGSYGAYKYWALSADERAADIHVSSPNPGYVQIVAMSNFGDGTVDQAMLDRISEICSAEKVRPLTDVVTVMSVVPIEYTVSVNLTIEKGASAEPVITEARNAILRLVTEKNKINTEIARSALIACIPAQPNNIKPQ